MNGGGGCGEGQASLAPRDTSPGWEERPSERYKADQRRRGDAVTSELRGWWPAFEGFLAPVSRVMVASARLGAGAQVVDVATGFGEPALTVARHLGPGGRVVATDLSAGMLEVAAERASARALGNVEFLQMDAEDPPLPEGRYDTVFCRLGLMFLPHTDAALRRLAALLVPRGSLVAAVWGIPQSNPWLTGALRTLSEYFELPASPPPAPGPFALSGPGVLRDALGRGGLDQVWSVRVPLRFAWPSPAAYAAFHRASPLRRLLPREEPAQSDRAWTDVAAAASRRWGPGPIRLPGEVVVAGGLRPLPSTTAPWSEAAVPAPVPG